MSISVRILGADDDAILSRLAPDVFDEEIDPRWAHEFLGDARHHLAVAIDGDTVVGMASAVHYVHPDKPPALWINEVGVASTHRRRGIGRRLLQALFARGRELGCGEAWLGTEPENTAARRLYLAAGGVETAMVMFAFDLTAEA